MTSFDLLLNQQAILDVPCRCGEWHDNVVAMTPTQKREANRNRVAWQSHVDAYLAADGTADAWSHRQLQLPGQRTATLDTMLVEGLI